MLCSREVVDARFEVQVQLIFARLVEVWSVLTAHSLPVSYNDGYLPGLVSEKSNPPDAFSIICINSICPGVPEVRCYSFLTTSLPDTVNLCYL